MKSSFVYLNWNEPVRLLLFVFVRQPQCLQRTCNSILLCHWTKYINHSKLHVHPFNVWIIGKVDKMYQTRTTIDELYSLAIHANWHGITIRVTKQNTVVRKRRMNDYINLLRIPTAEIMFCNIMRNNKQQSCKIKFSIRASSFNLLFFLGGMTCLLLVGVGVSTMLE
jgi:hypothetical protein